MIMACRRDELFLVKKYGFRRRDGSLAGEKRSEKKRKEKEKKEELEGFKVFVSLLVFVVEKPFF